MARPEIDIDANQVEKLARLGAKNTEIADFFDCSTDTIERRFAAELQKGRASLKMSLRQWQLKAAEKGNPTMLIWLGKQSLGQVDKSIHELSGPDGKPIETKSLTSLPDEKLDARIAEMLAKTKAQPNND
jgi:hypothetical protein